MRAETLPAHASVSPWISHFFAFEIDAPAHGFSLPLIANGFPSLIFQISERAWIHGEDRGLETLSLNGQYVAPVRLELMGRVSLLACFFRPHVLKALFGFEASELTGARLDLGLLRPAKDACLKERLLEAPSMDARADILRAFVLDLGSRRSPAGSGAASFATRAILESAGAIALGEIQARMGTTERSLQRVFDAEVGVSPRLFARICRFQSAFRRMNEGRFSALGDLAHDAGYADQSHFIRAFKEFAGMGPKEYLKRLSALRE
jgi:AraC-like DNA-binding protein